MPVRESVGVELMRVRVELLEPFLADRAKAAELRRRYLEEVEGSESVVLVDLTALRFITIASARVLIADWLVAARARAPLVAVIATPNVDVIESIDAALRQVKQGAYWIRSAAEPTDEVPEIIGDFTETNARTLAFFEAHPQATAQDYAQSEPDLKSNAATMRAVDLTRRGFLVRVDQPGKVGDLFIYPFVRSNGRRPERRNSRAGRGGLL